MIWDFNLKLVLCSLTGDKSLLMVIKRTPFCKYGFVDKQTKKKKLIFVNKWYWFIHFFSLWKYATM